MLPADGMRRNVVTAALFGLLFCCWSGVGAAAPQEKPIAGTCPAYTLHLRAARGLLGRGDRAAALTELRSAQAALTECLRDQAGEPTTVASRPSPTGATT